MNNITKQLGEYGEFSILMEGSDGEVIQIADWRTYNNCHEVKTSCDFQISIVNGCGLGSGVESVTYDELLNKVNRCCWIDMEDIENLKEFLK